MHTDYGIIDEKNTYKDMSNFLRALIGLEEYAQDDAETSRDDEMSALRRQQRRDVNRIIADRD